MNTTCKMAVDYYGKELQINLGFEKMGALIETIGQWRRGWASKAEVMSAIAEVIILCDQFCYIVDGTEEGVNICSDVIDQKLKLQRKRLEEYIASANTQKS